MRHALSVNDPVNDPINGPISGPINLTERQELILQMFAEDKCLSKGRLCEKKRDFLLQQLYARRHS